MAKEKINKNSLEFPRESRRTLKPSYDPEIFGRWSERFATILGHIQILGIYDYFCIILGYLEFTSTG